MLLKEVQVGCGKICCGNNGNSKQVLVIFTLPPRGGGELQDSIILTLEFVLIVHEELKVPNVIQNNSIMDIAPKSPELVRKMGKGSYFQFERVLEEGFRELCLP